MYAHYLTRDISQKNLEQANFFRTLKQQNFIFKKSLKYITDMTFLLSEDNKEKTLSF